MIVHLYAALHEECADECCDDRDNQVADLLGVGFSEKSHLFYILSVLIFPAEIAEMTEKPSGMKHFSDL